VAKKKKAKGAEVAAMLMKLGSDLPRALAKMNIYQRSAAVALLYKHIGFSPDVMGHLIAHPESVELRIIEVPGDAPAAIGDVLLDHTIYALAKKMEGRGHDVGKMLGLAGLDWPPGSGDFHGGGPLGNTSDMELLRRRELLMTLTKNIREGGNDEDSEEGNDEDVSAQHRTGSANSQTHQE
jgi:hypothetical protein